MKRCFIVLATAMLAFSCNESEDPKPNPNPEPGPGPQEAFITLSEDSHTFGKEGGTVDVTVESSGDWELLGDDSVFTPSVKNGGNGATVTFTAPRNDKAEPIEAEFTFLCDGETALFTITQTEGDEMTIAETTYTAPVTGGNVVINVSASGDFGYEIEEGCEWLSKPEAALLSVAQSQVTLSVAKNVTGKARSAKVTFTLGDLEEVITVNQPQNDVLCGCEKCDGMCGTDECEEAECHNKSLEVEKEGASDLVIKFKSNVNHQVSLSGDCSWVKLGNLDTAASDEGDGGPVYYTQRLTVEANSDDEREATIEIADPAVSDLKITVTVSQKGVAKLPEGQVMIPDANFRNKLVSLGYIEDASSEICTLTEAGKSATGTLNLASSNIADLTGIEAFTGITGLNISMNSGLTRVDLSGLTKIASFNSNGMSSLAYLNTGSNPIGEIYMPNAGSASASLEIIATGAKMLEITSPSYTSLDLSQCTSFTKVTITNIPNITGTLDLHNCTQLATMNLNFAMNLEKLIFSNEVKGSISYSPGASVNPDLQIEYE